MKYSKFLLGLSICLLVRVSLEFKSLDIIRNNIHGTKNASSFLPVKEDNNNSKDPEVQERFTSVSSTTFHLINGGKTISGAVYVNRKQSFFEFENVQNWQQANVCKNKIDFYNSTKPICSYCFSIFIEGEEVCRRGISLQAGFISDEVIRKRKLFSQYEENANHLRSYSEKNVEFFVQYRVVWVRCHFEEEVSKVNTNGGNLKIDGIDFSFPLDSSPTYLNNIKSQTEKNSIICGRAVYGGVSTRSIVKYVRFYREMWKFDTVIMYDIGLAGSTFSSSNEIKYLIQNGDLTVIDLRNFLGDLYGPLVNDVLLFSWVVGQVLLRYDCLLRAQSLNVDWVFFADMDEFLFPPRKIKAISSFSSFMQTFPSNVRWVSFGSLLAKDPDICSCSSKLSKWNPVEFLLKAQEFHEIEWKYSGESSPFECMSTQFDNRLCIGYHGRRKVAISANNAESMITGEVNLHHVGSCTFASARNLTGLDLNSEFFPYIRHYRCLNRNCRKSENSFWWRVGT